MKRYFSMTANPRKRNGKCRVFCFKKEQNTRHFYRYMERFIERSKTARGLHTALLLGFQRIWLRMS